MRQQAHYQRNNVFPSSAPSTVGIKIPSKYQVPINGAPISGQCRLYTALHPQTQLTLGFDGQPLPARYGFPLKYEFPPSSVTRTRSMCGLFKSQIFTPVVIGKTKGITGLVAVRTCSDCAEARHGALLMTCEQRQDGPLVPPIPSGSCLPSHLNQCLPNRLRCRWAARTLPGYGENLFYRADDGITPGEYAARTGAIAYGHHLFGVWHG